VLGVVLQPRVPRPLIHQLESAPVIEAPVPPPPAAVIERELAAEPVQIADTPAPPSPARVESVEGSMATVSTYSPERLSRAMRLISGVEGGALFPHLFAIRAFLPDRLIGAPVLEELLESERERLHELLDHLFIKLRLPRYLVSQKDLEDRAARTALVALMRGIAEQGVAASEPIPPAYIVLSGAMSQAEAASSADDLEQAPLGGARPWRALAALLPAAGAGEAGTTLGVALAAYRSRLLEAFGDLERLPPGEFHRILAARSPEPLDAALEQVRLVAARLGERATA
jgi:hypothetical protein